MRIGYFLSGFLLMGIMICVVFLASTVAINDYVYLFKITLKHVASYGLILIISFFIALIISILIKNTPILLPIISIILIMLFCLAIANYLIIGLSAAIGRNTFMQEIFSVLDMGLKMTFIIFTFLIPNYILVFLRYVAIDMDVFVRDSTTPSNNENEGRSFLIGFNTAMNVFLSLPIYFYLFKEIMSIATGSNPVFVIPLIASILITAYIGVINILTYDKSKNAVFHYVLSWTSILMPMTWIVQGLGVLFYFINLILNPLSYLFGVMGANAGSFLFGITAMSDVRIGMGTVFQFGGFCSNITEPFVMVYNFFARTTQHGTSYNLGNFIFFNTAFANTLSNSKIEDIKTHEEGHNLNLATFGTCFHFIGFADEGRGELFDNVVYAESLAEGNNAIIHRAMNPFRPLDVWNS